MTTEKIILIIISILTIHYLFFLLKIYFGLNKLTNQQKEELPIEFVSIIVPFRNEEKNILQTYNSLLKQNYPKDKYEIIFVNDASDDNSLKLLNNLSNPGSVKVISVPSELSVNAHKKRAIRYGIQNSNGEIIVTTDADCVHDKNWLKSLLNFMDENTGFISGPVEFTINHKWFSKIQRLEFAGLVITGAGLIGAGSPIICNAANIAYRKKIFEKVGGFSYQINLSSGDDELLMQKIHRDTNYKIKFALDKNAIVTTEANPTIKEFYHQRKRWASKSLFYGDNFLLLKLILIFLFYLSLIIQPLIGIFLSSTFFISFLITFLIKIFIEYSILKKGVNLLFNPDTLNPFLLTEILQVPYILISSIMGIFGNLIWKDRKIKR